MSVDMGMFLLLAACRPLRQFVTMGAKFKCGWNNGCGSPPDRVRLAIVLTETGPGVDNFLRATRADLWVLAYAEKCALGRRRAAPSGEPMGPRGTDCGLIRNSADVTG